MSGSFDVQSAIMNLINQHGGVSGLYSTFQQSGLGNVVESWIGTGQNTAVDPNQLSNALDDNSVNAAAEQSGMTKDDFLSVASQYLPMIVDYLTPQGNVPEHSSSGFLGMAMDFFQNRR